MDDILKGVGAIAFAIIILGIPVLFALSIAFIWPAFVIFLLFAFTFVDLLFVGTILHDFSDFLN